MKLQRPPLPYRRARRRLGMTLVEILVGMAISAILLSAGYAVYSAAVSGWSKSRRRTDMFQRARIALDLMGRCLRAAQVSDSSEQLVFDGVDQQTESPVESASATEAAELDMDTLTFRANAPIHLFGDKEVPDQTELEFYVEATPDEETGQTTASILNMRVDDTYDADPASGGWVVEVAEGVQQMNISYFNGTDWVQSWSSADGAPKAVEVGLTILDLAGKEDPMPFSRVIPIECWREAPSSRPVPTTEESSFGAARARGVEGETSAEAPNAAENQ